MKKFIIEIHLGKTIEIEAETIKIQDGFVILRKLNKMNEMEIVCVINSEIVRIINIESED